MNEIPSHQPKPDDNVKETIAKYYGAENVPDLYGFDAMRARVEAKQADVGLDLVKKAELASHKEQLRFPERLHEVVDMLEAQILSSYDGYRQVVNQLNRGRRVSERVLYVDPAELYEKIFASQLLDWQARGVLDFAAEKLATESTGHTLVITPNALVTGAEIIDLAESFGTTQPEPAFIYRPLYEEYTTQELSGHPQIPPGAVVHQGKDTIRLSLIPNKYSTELRQAPVIVQKAELEKLSALSPNLHLHVPSVLDAIIYWHVLKNQGYDLSDQSSNFYLTYIRHFDLPREKHDSNLVVPGTCIVKDGEAHLDRYFSFNPS